MLKRFMIKNYRNFRDNVCVDFVNISGYQFNMDCLTNGIISKMLIYGRNATGKTNLGRAFIDIAVTLLDNIQNINYGIFLNADSIENASSFSYTFQFGDKELLYKYARLSNRKLRDEELIIDDISVFKCDFVHKKFDFDNLKYIDAETANTEIYLQSLNDGEKAEEVAEYNLPFLRWLISNVALRSDSLLISLSNYVRRMMTASPKSAMGSYHDIVNDSFYESLENPERLQDLEEFLNAMGIECKLELKELPDGQKKLYFKHERSLLPFYETASSGTLALVDLYKRVIFKMWDASFLYLDEFDAFYHYEMAENVIKFFKRKYPMCQVIMTSHNTNLMTNRLMRPDCVFILSRTGTLTALCNATQRELREGPNLEKMYISGEFEKYE